ncbi:unnamed protein product [Candidula unifasciata]|uniref:Small ribosomal subunit protein mS38 n=1 Tax=Candidula unifasciata TaxID=100452 RepID=A0A8S4A704_9EUPU|nr:unnamed protein product [Candidula unifasciata]
MMHCRSLVGCSRLPLSTLSFAAGKHVPSLYLATQDSYADLKLTAKKVLPLLHRIGHQYTGSNGQVPVQKIHPFCQAKTLSNVIFESPLTESEQMRFSNKSQSVDLYKCPSRHTEMFSNMIILDNVPSASSFYDCPESSLIDSLKAPTVEKSQISEKPGTTAPKMEAKIIMRIRHKKMKKHKLKKLRKRMYALWHRQKLARKAKRMKIYWKEIEEIKKSAEQFNAEEFVKEQIAKAKKGGFSVSLLR